VKRLVISLVPPALLAGTLAFAHLGAVHGQAPPPPPPPGNPPTLTPPCPPTGCPTATPSPTPTPVPAALSVSHKTAKPGTTQKITVTTQAGAGVGLVISYPNGNQKKFNGTASSSGTYTAKFRQPGSRITRKSRTAKIAAKVGLNGATGGTSGKYSISFAHVDVSAQPRVQSRGKLVNIWLHAAPHSSGVRLMLTFSDHTRQTLYGKVGKHGWWNKKYSVPKHAPKGHVDVKGFATSNKHSYGGETSFTIH